MSGSDRGVKRANTIVAAFAAVACIAATRAGAQVVAAAAKAIELDVSGECRVAGDDERWIVASMLAWEQMQGELMPRRQLPKAVGVFFDDDCVYRIESMALEDRRLRVTATKHSGRVALPSGASFPVGVASFAAPVDATSVSFVMSLPTVWRAADRKFAFDMHRFLTAVMIHEMSHIVQFDTYLRRSATVAGIESLGKSIDDDVVQDRFAANPAFVASVDEEMQLLFAAAQASSPAECRSLAKRALSMMRTRQAANYVGDLRALTQLEDLFLTLEGSGQLAALRWLTLASGGALPEEVARREFGERVRFWSQRQGLALFLVLDRLNPDWRDTVYGDGGRTVLQMLEEAVR